MLNPKNDVEDNAEVGFIPMTNVEDEFSGNHSFEIREWKDVKKGYCHFQNGDIGVAKISPCFENLKSCIFHSLPNGIGAGTTELVILRSLGVYSPFYLYLFKSSWYVSQGTKYFKGVVGQQRVNKAIFTELEVPLPSYSEQKRIVAEIERWFALIKQIEQGKADLQTVIKQTKSKILDLAIHGKLVPQDPNDEPASELLKRINPKAEITCDNGQYGKMPNGWGLYKLGDVGKEYAIIVRTKDFQNNFTKDLIYTDKHGYDFLSKSKLFGGELMLPNIGASIGKVFIIPNLNHPMTLGPNSVIISFKDDITKSWAYYLFLSPFGQELLLAISSSTAQGKFNKTDLRNTFFPLPPLTEQHRIVDAIQKAFAKLDAIMESL